MQKFTVLKLFSSEKSFFKEISKFLKEIFQTVALYNGKKM